MKFAIETYIVHVVVGKKIQVTVFAAYSHKSYYAEEVITPQIVKSLYFGQEISLIPTIWVYFLSPYLGRSN